MNAKTLLAFGICLIVSVADTLAFMTFDESALITTITIIIGLPGFAFGLMIFPGVHADKQTIAVVMTFVNSLFYFLMISIILKRFHKPVTHAGSNLQDDRGK